jgi:hypothetical protein
VGYSLWGIGAVHLEQRLLLILVIVVRIVAGGQAQCIGLAFLLLAGRRSIRLLMMVGGRLSIWATVPAAHLVATKLGARLEGIVMKPATTAVLTGIGPEVAVLEGS